jgi:hypothetical protein
MSIVLFRKSLAQRIAALLRLKTATAWIAGIGPVQGLTAGNYQESTGVTPAVVDGLLGLVLDAAGASGSEIVVNGTAPLIATTGWTAAGTATPATLAIVNGELEITATGVSAQSATQTFAGFVIGKTYRIQATYHSGASNAIAKSTRVSILDPGVAFLLLEEVSANGVERILSRTFVATKTSLVISIDVASVAAYGSVGDKAYLTSMSVKLLSGTHAIQATAGSRPTLRKTVSVYWFDTTGGTKTLGATLPAGYESCIVVDAAKTGATVATAQNLTGAYSLATDTCGRIIIPGTLALPATLTTAETALLTSFANRLAGL